MKQQILKLVNQIKENLKSIDKDGYVDESVYTDFVNWYTQNENNAFDFEIEFKTYCTNDVELLMEACLIYRNGY